MDLGVLRKSVVTRVSHGRPSSTLTDREWQNQFAIARLYTTPHSAEITKMGGKFSQGQRKVGEENGTYDGMTNWQSYCAFINDVLREIRAGRHDYVYFGYHIIELLKFHHDTLKTRYCDGYWEVWLERRKVGA